MSISTSGLIKIGNLVINPLAYTFDINPYAGAPGRETAHVGLSSPYDDAQKLDYDRLIEGADAEALIAWLKNNAVDVVEKYDRYISAHTDINSEE